jgi:CBS-domain-containing membrane protein
MKSTVRDVMTTRVIWVKKGASFREIAAAFREYRISAFPVIDEDRRVIGVVSEADLLAKQALDGGEDGMPGMITGLLRRREQEKARGVTAGDVMSSPAVTVRPEDTVEHAARLMYTRRVKRLPVVDADGHLVGIIGRADVLSVFDRTDAQIRNEIVTDVLHAEFLIDPKEFKVRVKDGVVTLEGRAGTAVLGQEIVRRVGHVQGVVAVRDRLSYPPAG